MTEQMKADIRTLFEAWIRSTGVSKMCGDALRAVHCGEGSIDVSALSQLDPAKWSAMSRLLDCKHASEIPIEGISDALKREEFHELLPGFQYNPSAAADIPDGP